MYIRQRQLDNLKNSLKPGKVVVIYGARRTGKTTLLNEYLKTETEPYLLVSGEDITIHGISGFPIHRKAEIIRRQQPVADNR